MLLEKSLLISVTLLITMSPVADISADVVFTRDDPTASLLHFNHLERNATFSDYKLKLLSLVFSYVLGYCIEMTATFVASR